MCDVKKYEQIYISGGRIGTTLKVNPLQLAETVHARFEDITAVTHTEE